VLTRYEWISALIHFGWDHKMVQVLWKTVWQVLEMITTESPYDLAIWLLGIYPKQMKSTCPLQNLYTNIQRSIIHSRLKVETTSTPTNWWMDEQHCVFRQQKEVLTPAPTWMNTKIIILGKKHRAWENTYFYDSIYVKCSEQANP
jgi:hypothetical protein